MTKKEKNKKYYEAIGRRKRSIARVRLYLLTNDSEIEINGVKVKRGEIIVNSKPIKSIFQKDYEIDYIKTPLKLTNNEDRFAIYVIVKSGGQTGQKEAIILGLARALVLVDSSYKEILRKNSLLTRDPRKKERRKVGMGGKARREKQSPKR